MTTEDPASRFASRTPPQPPEDYVPPPPRVIDPEEQARTDRYNDVVGGLFNEYKSLGLPLSSDDVYKALNYEASRDIAQKALSQLGTQPAYLQFDDISMEDVLKQPEQPIQWRIEYLLQAEHNTTVAAAAKTGKTVLAINRLKSLVDGTEFLGRFPVITPVEGNVAYFNYELGERQMHAWIRSAQIKRPERLWVRNLRGKGLYLQDDTACEATVNWLRLHDIEIWEIDPLQAALRGSVNDDAVAAEWIANVEKVKAEAGVKDLIVTTHTGHLSKADDDGYSANERSIGSSRWIGWPDNLWTYVNIDGTRFLRAVGRDVDMPEFGVDFDRSTLMLTDKGKGTSRVAIKSSRAWKAIMELFAGRIGETLLKTTIEDLIHDKYKIPAQEVRKALSAAADEPDNPCLERVPGPRLRNTGPPPDAYHLTAMGTFAVKSRDLTVPIL